MKLLSFKEIEEMEREVLVEKLQTFRNYSHAVISNYNRFELIPEEKKNKMKIADMNILIISEIRQDVIC